MTSQTHPVLTQPDIADDSAPWTSTWARDVVCEVLTDLPGRLAHSLQAGAQAAWASRSLPAADAQLLIIAAYLHDVGYAPSLQRTGFHPLDGATFLRDLGAPERVVGLVAHHSEAWLLAGARGLLPELFMFSNERSPLTDALTYADMTAGPCGEPITLTDRLVDIRERHADEPLAMRLARSAREPFLRAAVDRVHERASERSTVTPGRLTGLRASSGAGRSAQGPE
jgi:putative nucleotidyltransferase with HDIG domain